MSEVQGTLEFSVELHKFHNVDLFQRGFYQIRAALKLSPRVPHRVIVSTRGNTDECSFSSPGVYDGTVFSRIFQILYRNEEITVNDCMNFKVHVLLDGEKVEDALSEVDFQLKLDLHFTENEQQLAEITTVPLISSRTLGLHIHPRRGLHHHVPVMFDYFHLSVISVSIHASLTALHQPLMSFARSGKGSSWLGKGSPEGAGSEPSAMSVENLMFGAGYCKPVISEGSFYVASESCLQRAHTWHRRLCRLLLAAHRGLHTYRTALAKEIPQLQQSTLDLEELPVEETLHQLTAELQLQEGSEKVAEQISRDVSQLCSQLGALWSCFLEAAVLNPHMLSYLAQEHHTLRVRRFSEAYFFTEHQKETSLTFQEDLINRHGQIAAEVRCSDYLSRMPPLPVECLDIDGDWNSLPIIFEDRFVESPQTKEQATAEMTHSGAVINAAGGRRSHERGQQQSPTPWEPSDGEDYMDLPTYVSSLNGEQSRNSQSPVLNQEGPVPSPTKPGRTESESDEQGLRDVVPRPTDTDPPCRGLGPVLILSSIADSNTTGLTDESSAHHQRLDEDDDVTASLEYAATTGERHTSHNGEDSSNVTVLLTRSMDDESEDAPVSPPDNPPRRTRPDTPPPGAAGDLRRELTTLHHHRAGSSSSSKVLMKRSSSVISDSGIESEPSSVALAWPGGDASSSGRTSSLLLLRGGGGHPTHRDFCSEREIPQRTVPGGRHHHHHTAHRSSLEGLQMESHGSLPSSGVNMQGIQASLTSISSLPYEEDQQHQRHHELSTLTKSMSAPQISSPEDPEEDHHHHLTGQEPPADADTFKQHQGINHFSLEDIQEGEQCDTVPSSDRGGAAVLQRDRERPPPPPTKEPDVLIAGRVEDDHIIDGVTDSAHVHLFEAEGTSSSPSCGRRASESAADSESTHPPASDEDNFRPIRTPQGEEGAAAATASGGPDGCHSRNGTNNNATQRPSQLGLITGDRTPPPHHGAAVSRNALSNGHPTTTAREPLAAGREDKPSSQVPNNHSGLHAFVNKRVVEVVNMSVSCAPTCLPFSSVLRDSPSVGGMSARQTTSPITHQPLGSFGIVSSSSSFNTLMGMDEESNQRMMNFYKAKEELLEELSFQAGLYSDLPLLASDLPYFPPEEDEEEFDDGIHLVVCVHGLDGNSADLRLVKTFIELGLPGSRLDFLMSERNQTDTFADFDTMTDRLLDEIIQHIQLYNLTVGRISFIGHSLGNIIIRSVLTRPRFRCYLAKLHTFLSLSGPHLGTLYNNSTLVSTGLWLMQKLKKSGSLLQLTFRDHVDPRKTFLYLLSQKPGLQFFKNVVLVASPQDRYVPFHSARIEMCKTALRDRTTGPVYTEMITNLLQPLLEAKECRLIRHDVFHALPNTANTLIGRAAHIAVLDSELFLEKFFLVAGLNYFK